MIKTFTQDDLIRYLYHETSENEEREIKKALLSDSELQACYADLCSIKQEMDNAQIEPSSDTVMRILEYSKNSSAVKH